MEEQEKVAECLNVTVDDTKLFCLQKVKKSESLKTENLSDYYKGEDKHEVVTGSTTSVATVDLDLSGGSIGNNTVTQFITETVGQSGGSSTSTSTNSGGASEEGSTSHYTQYFS